MKDKKPLDLGLTAYDELFMTDEQRVEARKPTVDEVPLEKLFGFADHPFKIRDDEDMKKLVESISETGVLIPAIVRRTDDGYEIISGHRRCHACKLAGLETMPVIVQELNDEEAVITLVDSNLHREKILPSEKAFAYKMKMEAMNSQGQRTDLTSTQVVSKLRTAGVVGAANGDSREQVRRFIRLTNLIPELLDLVDKERIALTPAVELSYLKVEEQANLLELIESEDCTPSLSQAVKLKNLSQSSQLTQDNMLQIMIQEKANQTQKVSFKYDDIKRFFPKNYTPQQIQTAVLKMLQREYERKHDKDAR